MVRTSFLKSVTRTLCPPFFSQMHVFRRNGRLFDNRIELAIEAKNTRDQDRNILDLARDHVRSNVDREYDNFNDFMTLSTKSGKSFADQFEAAVHAPNKTDVATAYAALATEVVSQWRTLVDAGYTMEPWTGKGDPYQVSSAKMIADVRKNKHLWYFPTENGFGHDPQALPTTHPMLEPSGIVVEGRNIPVNDVFRAVHDAFGHAMSAFTFTAKGEYNAFLSHVRMFSSTARPALAAETLLQNSWVNFGKHLRREDGTLPAQGDDDWTPPRDRPFADQKAFNPDSDFLRKLTIAKSFDITTQDPFPEGVVHAYPSLRYSFPGRVYVVLHGNTRLTGDLQQIGEIYLVDSLDGMQWRIQRTVIDGEFGDDVVLCSWFISKAIECADQLRIRPTSWLVEIQSPRPVFMGRCYDNALSIRGYEPGAILDEKPVAASEYDPMAHRSDWSGTIVFITTTRTPLVSCALCKEKIGVMDDADAGMCSCGTWYCDTTCQSKDWDDHSGTRH